MCQLKRVLVGTSIAVMFAFNIATRVPGSSTASAQSIPHPTLRVYTSEVLVPVTVTDRQNRYVTGLQKEDFQVSEDRIEQKIETFYIEEAPMSLGIILDTSESMKFTLRDASQIVSGCLKGSTLSDEFFLVLISSRATPTTEFTTDIRELQNMILFLKATGWTALYDGIYEGLVKMKEAVNPRKALVIASDGGENNSRHRAGELKRMIQEQDVQIYTTANQGAHLIRDLAEMTGGRALDTDAGSFGNICSAMMRELKNQYMLVYKSTNTARDGTLRNIRVKVTPRGGVTDLSIRARRQYFVPKDANNSEFR